MSPKKGCSPKRGYKKRKTPPKKKKGYYNKDISGDDEDYSDKEKA